MANYFLDALNNKVDTIQKYLRYGNVNIIDDNGKSLLHYAARGNAMEVSKLLLDNYINPNITDNNGETALFEAVLRGEIGLVKLLLRNKADINILNNNGESLFFKAINRGNDVMLDLLRDNEKIDFSLLNQNDENVLFYALKAQKNTLFKEIATADLLKQKDYHKRNLVMVAIMYNNEELFDYLYHDEVNLYEADNDNMNLLFYAARYGTSYICNTLLKRNPIIAGKDKNGLTIFDYAKQNDNYVYEIFDNYAHKTAYMDYQRIYPYHVAVISRNYDLLNYVMPNIKKEDADGISIERLIELINDPVINKLFNK